MESKRDLMLVTVMIVMMMGDLLTQTKAQGIPYLQCLQPCLEECRNHMTFPDIFICPHNCFHNCLNPSPSPPDSPSPPNSPSPPPPSPPDSPSPPPPSPSPYDSPYPSPYDSPSLSPSPYDSPSPSSSPWESPSPSPLLDEDDKIIEQSDVFCKLSCTMQHCASLSTVQDPNVEKVAACVESCSSKCSSNN